MIFWMFHLFLCREVWMNNRLRGNTGSMQLTYLMDK